MTCPLPTFLAILAALLSPLAAGAASPNIVWVIADDIGPEVLGCYGHPTIDTPHLDALAKNGVKFEHAFVTTSSCSPSRSSLFTGRYPHATGAENLHDPLPEGMRIVPGYLREAGYWTANVGKLHLGPNGAAQFDVVERPVDHWREAIKKRPNDKPFFFSLGFIDAHRKFERGAAQPPFPTEDVVVPPYYRDTPETREDIAAFYDEIRRLDRVTGELIQYLMDEGELENTLFLFMGDNGNPFPREKTTLYDSGIATPLLMHWPARFQKREVYTGLVSLVDLAPTVLEAVGVPIPEDMQGVSLLKQLAAPGDHGREYIFAEKNWHDFEDHSRAVRDDRYKYIRNAHADRPLIPAADVINSPTYRALQAAHEAGELTEKQQQHFTEHRAKEELYDLDRDPLEINNLADDPAQEETLERLRGALDTWIKETGDVTTDRNREDQFDPVSGNRIQKK